MCKTAFFSNTTVLNPYCCVDIDDTWLTATVKERDTTIDMLGLACDTERGTDGQEIEEGEQLGKPKMILCNFARGSLS